MRPFPFAVQRVRKLRAPLIAIAIIGIALSAIADDPPDEPKKTYADTPPQYEPYGRFTEPYERFFLDPLEFRGYGRTWQVRKDPISRRLDTIHACSRTGWTPVEATDYVRVIVKACLDRSFSCFELAILLLLPS